MLWVLRNFLKNTGCKWNPNRFLAMVNKEYTVVSFEYTSRSATQRFFNRQDWTMYFNEVLMVFDKLLVLMVQISSNTWKGVMPLAILESVNKMKRVFGN